MRVDPIQSTKGQACVRDGLRRAMGDQTKSHTSYIKIVYDQTHDRPPAWGGVIVATTLIAIRIIKSGLTDVHGSFTSIAK